ncbi:MAG: oxidoreductase, partial [Chloroflexi bacterium]
FEKVYFNNPTIDNPDRILPQHSTEVAEGKLTLPHFYHTVKSLDQVVEVDYFIPGCPPEPPQIWAVLQVVIGALTAGQPLPPAGSIIGAGTMALCDECTREKKEKTIKRFFRPYEIQPNPDQCLLEQGIICMGIATRSGCGALCPSVGIGCRGCYGPPDGVEDQGAKMLSAIASVLDVGHESMDEDVLEELIQEAVDTIADPAGTFYRFSMAHSILKRVKNGKGAA